PAEAVGLRRDRLRTRLELEHDAMRDTPREPRAPQREVPLDSVLGLDQAEDPVALVGLLDDAAACRGPGRRAPAPGVAGRQLDQRVLSRFGLIRTRTPALHGG